MIGSGGSTAKRAAAEVIGGWLAADGGDAEAALEPPEAFDVREGAGATGRGSTGRLVAMLGAIEAARGAIGRTGAGVAGALSPIEVPLAPKKSFTRVSTS